MEGLGKLAERLKAVDHLAIAVEDLEEAVRFYTEGLGFEEVERRRTEGRKTGMDSVVLKGNNLKIVLIKGTSEESQVTRYIRAYGPGVQHVAFLVEGIEEVVADLKARGLGFDTDILEVPGLKQAFSQRDPVSGMMFEIIERTGAEGFADQNVQRLFQSLEEKENF
jgi:methylmalonyl-CoA/ethylmalonyl-CoA epimerase